MARDILPTTEHDLAAAIVMETQKPVGERI